MHKKFLWTNSRDTSSKTNMDTQNDGLEKVDYSFTIWPCLVSMLDFCGVNMDQLQTVLKSSQVSSPSPSISKTFKIQSSLCIQFWITMNTGNVKHSNPDWFMTGSLSIGWWNNPSVSGIWVYMIPYLQQKQQGFGPLFTCWFLTACSKKKTEVSPRFKMTERHGGSTGNIQRLNERGVFHQRFW